MARFPDVKLADLDVKLKYIEEKDGQTYFVPTDDMAKADGICFLCPKCYHAAGKTNVGVHSVICWRPRVHKKYEPGPGRWEFEGNSLAELTLKAGSSSIQLSGGCDAHFFVKRGVCKDA